MRILWLTALIAFAVDQISKYVVFFGLTWRAEQMEVLPPLIVFRRGYNTGINFGLFAEGSDSLRWMLIGLAIAISIGLIVWAKRSFGHWFEFTAGGLVIGGALGNGLDRVFHQGVLDFLNMSCCGISNPYIFNIADIFIFAGAIGLALWPSGKKAS